MTYLTLTEIIAINVQIQRHSQTLPAIRDDAALDYIIQSANQAVFGKQLYNTPVKLATYYVIKLTKKHVFNDANKRTAYLALMLFLAKNQLKFIGNHLVLAQLIVKIAQVDGESDEIWAETNDYLMQNIKA